MPKRNGPAQPLGGMLPKDRPQPLQQAQQLQHALRTPSKELLHVPVPHQQQPQHQQHQQQPLQQHQPQQVQQPEQPPPPQQPLHQHPQQQPRQQPHPLKKIKTEPREAAQHAQAHPPPPSEQPEPKRSRQQPDMAMGAPTPARSGSNLGGFASPPRQGGDGITRALSEIRRQLETVSDVEGVRELLGALPSCVLVGGIAARRELVGALLGDHGVAQSAAALLVAPGMRQPVALELRYGGQDFGSLNNPEAEQWLRAVSDGVSQALGQRLKTDQLRLRICAMGCASLDALSLPELVCQEDTDAAQPKVEEMRSQYLGQSANLLVCLEPGAPLELCRRFDARLQRTVLLGAASPGGQMLCGVPAARSLEEKFAAVCRRFEPQWQSNLERFEVRLVRAQTEAREAERHECSEEMLRRARSAGLSFSRALQQIISGAPGCNAGALTLEEELMEFAATAAKGQCFSKGLSAQDTAAAAVDLFAHFDGVEGYANYLRTEVGVPGADMALNGGAAWARLLAEIEVAMRLSHPPPEELAGLMLAAIRLGGTGVHGHQRWEDVASKLMLSIAHEPLRQRIRYVTARIMWVLKRQKAAISEWMSTVSDGPAAKLYSPLFSQHVAILRQYPIVRDLVFSAYDEAASTVAEEVLKNLEGTLMAACINPEIMLRPSTEPVLDVNQVDPPKSRSDRFEDERKRVAGEMRKRDDLGGGLPVPLRDRIFEPSEAARTLPFVELKLRHAFAVLTDILSNHTFAFADTSLAALCRRHVDEAMNNISFNGDQQKVLATRHAELEEVAQQVESRLGAVRKCITALRNSGA
mmetsp:Transcript_101127/g.286646  ORF Transcript_101127/g.286646 Transcript_101127/m.286646 type:complete len:810 (+) Transcript_101127:60-2489(+)